MKLETLRKNNISKIVISLAIISGLILVVTLVTSRAKYIKTQSVTIVDNEIKFTPYDFKIMAMYKQIDGCSDTSSDACYTKMGDDERMPSKSYLINEALSYCSTTANGPKDNDARIYTNNKGEHVISNIEKGSKCYLYFEKEKTNGDIFLDNRICNIASSTITNEEAKNCLIDEDGYRYEGINPNNYVTFNNEEWRIIGVFNVETNEGKKENLIKLIRINSIGSLAWDDEGTNNWDKPATLNTLLNNDYLNSTGEYNSNGLINVKDKIANVKLNIGASNDQQSVAKMYNDEIKVQSNDYYPVGLITASDYGYASLASTCDRNIILFSYHENDGCVNQNWIYKKEHMWTMTPYPFADAVQVLNENGALTGNSTAWPTNARPSIYLKANVSLVDGNDIGEIGSSTNPYIVK